MEPKSTMTQKGGSGQSRVIEIDFLWCGGWRGVLYLPPQADSLTPSSSLLLAAQHALPVTMVLLSAIHSASHDGIRVCGTFSVAEMAPCPWTACQPTPRIHSMHFLHSYYWLFNLQVPSGRYNSQFYESGPEWLNVFSCHWRLDSTGCLKNNWFHPPYSFRRRICKYAHACPAHPTHFPGILDFCFLVADRCSTSGFVPDAEAWSLLWCIGIPFRYSSGYLAFSSWAPPCSQHYCTIFLASHLYELTNEAIVYTAALLLGIPMPQAMFLKSQGDYNPILIFGDIFCSTI